MSDDHLSFDELAELDEGLLPSERISAIRAHLHGCDQCRARAEAITATRSELANLPSLQMPADVVERIDDALGDLAPPAIEPRPFEPRAVTPDQTPDNDRIDESSDEGYTGSDTVIPNIADLPRRRRQAPGRPSLAGSAAAAAIVLAIGAIVVAHFHHHPHVSNNISASEGVNAPAVGSSGRTISTRQPKDFIESSTGLSYSPTTLAADVAGLLAGGAPSATGAPGGSTQGSSGGGRATSSTASGSGGNSTASGTTTTTGKGSSSSTNGSAPRSTPTPTSTHHGAAIAGPAPVAAVPVRTLADQPVPRSIRPLYNSHKRLLACAATMSGVPGAVPAYIDAGRWTNTAQNLHRTPAIFLIFDGAKASLDTVYVVGPTCNFLDYSEVNVPS